MIQFILFDLKTNKKSWQAEVYITEHFGFILKFNKFISEDINLQL